MSLPDLPSHHETTRAVAALQLGVDASELHGALCGFVCGGGVASPHDWLAQLAIDPPAGSIEALAQLFEATCAQLADADFGFALLLPDETQPLGERADALIAWTRGFLGGFGLAAGERPALSEEASEALQDLSAIAGASLSYEDPDSDEESLVEIAEFIRVAALLLQDERAAPRPGSQRLH